MFDTTPATENLYEFFWSSSYLALEIYGDGATDKLSVFY
jgi:hypothetical protein